MTATAEQPTHIASEHSAPAPAEPRRYTFLSLPDQPFGRLSVEAPAPAAAAAPAQRAAAAPPIPPMPRQAAEPAERPFASPWMSAPRGSVDPRPVSPPPQMDFHLQPAPATLPRAIAQPLVQGGPAAPAEVVPMPATPPAPAADPLASIFAMSVEPTHVMIAQSVAPQPQMVHQPVAPAAPVAQQPMVQPPAQAEPQVLEIAPMQLPPQPNIDALEAGLLARIEQEPAARPTIVMGGGPSAQGGIDKLLVGLVGCIAGSAGALYLLIQQLL